MYSWHENIKHFPFSRIQDASQVSRTNSDDNEDFQRMNKRVGENPCQLFVIHSWKNN